MRKFRIILTYLCTLLIFASCIKDKYSWDECNPEIWIRFDWSTVTQPGDDQTVTVVITDPDENSIERNVPPAGEQITLIPKTYEFTGHTSTEYVTVDHRTVTVRKDTDGNYFEPGYFTGGSVSQEIIFSHEDQVVTIPMRSQTRPLIIRVITLGQAAGNLSYISGTISGIAMSRDINNGFIPIDGQPLHLAYENGSVAYVLTADEENPTTYSDMKNLLGLDGASNQILQLTVHFASGNLSGLQLDVTTEMTGFHTENVDEPWVLELTINLISELEATIEEWQGNYESSLQLH